MKVNECKGGRASHGYFFVGDGTALHWAAYYGQLEIAKLLLDKGAGICSQCQRCFNNVYEVQQYMSSIATVFRSLWGGERWGDCSALGLSVHGEE